MKVRRYTEYTGFHGSQCFASGSLPVVVTAARHLMESTAAGALVVIDNTTGCAIDIDVYPPAAEPDRQRRAAGASAADDEALLHGLHGRGRPRLGVVAREVTLLPHQWAWLAAQSGNLSAVLRKLIEMQIQRHPANEAGHAARARACRFVSAMADELDGTEAAIQALLSDDLACLLRAVEHWPPDVRDHALLLATDGSDWRSAGEP
ncbi:DUF2239 family protein [Burkholderia sp. Ap-962]|uniref:DUF2239 family protein n=1 Tax=Burkholderia sp. Ap-962 TaxID=2608333 RepID=UPI001423B55D|nr:DUF2239 family protein [Burkholderia sp. Ap-962]NIF70297.1 DUF2239 family protein [Burkholderia sp. Ap-962]